MISILIPTLGEREFEITRLLDSLCAQTNKAFNIVFVNQGNQNKLNDIINRPNYNELDCIHIFQPIKGISRSRNEGLKQIPFGTIVWLSDDDAWYPKDGVEKIANCFAETDSDVVISQIYDPLSKQYYKKYPTSLTFNTRGILGRSSIEIAFKWRETTLMFDERFGLGATYPSAEEVDFLLSNRKNAIFTYLNDITVYHEKKESMATKKSMEAKGALYAKHFNLGVGIVVLIRDLIKKKQNNFKEFMNGYKKFKKQ